METARIAFRNLYRQKRRTGLTVSIIAFGVVAVILFTALAGSFKNMMISQITDSMLGHLQIHRSGYVESLDTMPLNLVIEEKHIDQLKKTLGEIKEIEGYTLRILLATMLSNYADTTNIKLSAIEPGNEKLVTPLLPGRITEGKFLEKGQILLPNLVARGLELGIGSEAVVIATNVDGSVNGTSLIVSGIVDTAVGPSGKYGYIPIDHPRSRGHQRRQRQTGLRSPPLESAEPVQQHRQHDRSDDDFHSGHTGDNSIDKHHERNADGGIRAHQRNRHHRRDRHHALVDHEPVYL